MIENDYPEICEPNLNESGDINETSAPVLIHKTNKGGETHADGMRKKIVNLLATGVGLIVFLVGCLYWNGKPEAASEVMKMMFTPVFTATSIIISFYFAERK